MYKISVLWEHWCYRCYRCYRFTHIPKLEAPLTWAEQADNDADVCSGTWVSTAELAEPSNSTRTRGQGTHLDPTRRLREPQGGQCLWDPGLAVDPRLGGSPSTLSLYLPPCIWGETRHPWTGRILHQSFCPRCRSVTTTQSMAWTGLRCPLGWIIPNFPALSHLVAAWAWRIPVPCLS